MILCKPHTQQQLDTTELTFNNKINTNNLYHAAQIATVARKPFSIASFAEIWRQQYWGECQDTVVLANAFCAVTKSGGSSWSHEQESRTRGSSGGTSQCSLTELPLGPTAITIQAFDKADPFTSSICTTVVTVVDREPPMINQATCPSMVGHVPFLIYT